MAASILYINGFEGLCNYNFVVVELFIISTQLINTPKSFKILFVT
jgi:hypothetical protein